MTRLPRLTGRRVISTLRKTGFKVIRVKGSHHFLQHPEGRCTVVPVHSGETIGPGRRICGLLVEQGMEGFSAPETHGKWSLRASATGELVFDNVKVPKENLLSGKDGLGAPMMCLNSARYGIAWGAIGAAMDCYDSARRYLLERIQFDKPIGSFQLTQKKLAEMLTEITKAQLLNWKLGKMMDEGNASTAQISMAKRNSVEVALNIAREARQIHGGAWVLQVSIQ